MSEPDLEDPTKRAVLVVDDDESARDFISQTVRREGFRVDQADHGAAVLHQVKTSRPDLIVLDLMLPGRSGYEVVRELRQSGFGDIPVIMITARLVDSKTIEMIKQEPNVRDFAQKPLVAERLALTIHSLLKTRPAERPPAAS